MWSGCCQIPIPFSVYFLLNGCSKNEKKRETFLMNLNRDKIFFYIFGEIKLYHKIINS